MAHPGVILVTLGMALGAAVALFGFFASAHQTRRAELHHEHKGLDFDYVDTSRMCTICISEIKSHLVYLNCGHAFHRRCIQPWLNKSNTCPNCKRVQERRS